MAATSESTYHYVLSSYWCLTLAALSWLLLAALSALGSRRTFPYFWNREYKRKRVSPSVQDDGDYGEESPREQMKVVPYRPPQAAALDLVPTDSAQRRQPDVFGMPPTDKFNRAPARNEAAGRHSWQ